MRVEQVVVGPAEEIYKDYTGKYPEGSEWRLTNTKVRLRQAENIGANREAVRRVPFTLVALLLALLAAAAALWLGWRYSEQGRRPRPDNVAVVQIVTGTVLLQSEAPNFYEALQSADFATNPTTKQMYSDVAALVPIGGKILDALQYQGVVIVEIDNGDGTTYTEVLVLWVRDKGAWLVQEHTCVVGDGPPGSCEGR